MSQAVPIEDQPYIQGEIKFDYSTNSRVSIIFIINRSHRQLEIHELIINSK